jgi:hypothetical protein
MAHLEMRHILILAYLFITHYSYVLSTSAY